MDRDRTRIIAYALIVSAVAALFGMAIMKFSAAAKETPADRTQTLHSLENSSAVTSAQGRNFIHNEQSRQDDTSQALDDVSK